MTDMNRLLTSVTGLMLVLLCLAPAAVLGQESLSERTLRNLVQEEKRILNGSRMADGSYDEEILARRYQGLVHQYDAFIHANPDFAAGYVAYARVLERIGQERAARAMYLKANQLDPNIPLVKNQLGNFLAEEGEFAKALPYYLAAIELEPEEPLYHYQLGNLLHHFRDEFIEEKMFTRAVLDAMMIEAFAQAAKLAPNQTAFAYRHAESFYDLAEPRWEEALAAWAKLEKKVASPVEKQTIFLHRANIAIQQAEPEKARKLLDKVTEPALGANKARLLEKLKERGEFESMPVQEKSG